MNREVQHLLQEEDAIRPSNRQWAKYNKLIKWIKEKKPFWRRESASAVCGNTAEGSTSGVSSGTCYTIVCT